MRREVIGAIVGGLLGLAGTGLLFGPRAVEAVRLSGRGVVGEAIVTDVSRKRTCTVAYAFETEGHEYGGQEGACPATKGERRRVHYLPHDPRVSTLRTPMGALAYGVTPILVVSLWCAVTGWALLWPRRLSSRARPAAGPITVDAGPPSGRPGARRPARWLPGRGGRRS
jgi:hypothetical protein